MVATRSLSCVNYFSKVAKMIMAVYISLSTIACVSRVNTSWRLMLWLIDVHFSKSTDYLGDITLYRHQATTANEQIEYSRNVSKREGWSQLTSRYVLEVSGSAQDWRTVPSPSPHLVLAFFFGVFHSFGDILHDGQMSFTSTSLFTQENLTPW